MKKLKSGRGESLIETLAATLIIVLGMTLLAGAIVTAARVNKAAGAENTPLFAQREAKESKPGVNIEVAVAEGETATYQVTVKAYRSEADEDARTLYEYTP